MKKIYLQVEILVPEEISFTDLSSELLLQKEIYVEYGKFRAAEGVITRMAAYPF